VILGRMPQVGSEGSTAEDAGDAERVLAVRAGATGLVRVSGGDGGRLELS
jgi:hypothetical protein